MRRKELKVLEAGLREDCIELMEILEDPGAMTEDEFEFNNKLLAERLKQWKEVNTSLEERDGRIFEAAKEGGKIVLSLGANVVLILIAGRVEFMQGRLMPSFAKPNIPITGTKI